MSKSSVNGVSTSFATLLGITFIVLKLTNVIDWSWWWVLAPFWIGAAIGVVILITIIILAVIFSDGL